ncbi:uncharacterized protein LOC110839776 isoform X2 [Zootermopsis nevadensis]|uniref:uncharacterized protein LOC110839776 isoform X2 n=1 Tax=Zootermopsis nevadensis TaxID=136037 RepID=UPI000B8ECE56|nr:uncharacterized protein LOC110839776 isoform X2 [Zootermopsis nevadensis]
MFVLSFLRNLFKTGKKVNMATVPINQHAFDFCTIEETGDFQSQNFEENGNFEKTSADQTACNTESVNRKLAQNGSTFDKAGSMKEERNNGTNNAHSAVTLEDTKYFKLVPNTRTPTTDDEKIQTEQVKSSATLTLEELEDAESTTQPRTEVNTSSAEMLTKDVHHKDKPGETDTQHLASETSAIRKLPGEEIGSDGKAPVNEGQLTAKERRLLYKNHFGSQIMKPEELNEARKFFGLTTFKSNDSTDLADTQSNSKLDAEIISNYEDIHADNTHEIQVVSDVDTPNSHSNVCAIMELSGQETSPKENIPAEQKPSTAKQKCELNEGRLKTYSISREEIKEVLQPVGLAINLADTQSNRKLCAENTPEMQIVGVVDAQNLHSNVSSIPELSGQAISPKNNVPKEQRRLTVKQKSEFNEERLGTYTISREETKQAVKDVGSITYIVKKPTDLAHPQSKRKVCRETIAIKAPITTELLKYFRSRSFVKHNSGNKTPNTTNAGTDVLPKRKPFSRPYIGNNNQIPNSTNSNAQSTTLFVSRQNIGRKIEIPTGANTNELSSKTSCLSQNFGKKTPIPTRKHTNVRTIRKLPLRENVGCKHTILTGAVADEPPRGSSGLRQKFGKNTPIQTGKYTNVRPTKAFVLRQRFSSKNMNRSGSGTDMQSRITSGLMENIRCKGTGTTSDERSKRISGLKQNFGRKTPIITGGYTNVQPTRKLILGQNFRSKILIRNDLGTDGQSKRTSGLKKNVRCKGRILIGAGTNKPPTKSSCLKQNFVRKIPIPTGRYTNVRPTRTHLLRKSRSNKILIRNELGTNVQSKRTSGLRQKIGCKVTKIT